MGDHDHPTVKIVLPGLNVFSIKNEADLQRALRNDVFKRNPDLFKSAVELNPLIVILNRLVHCIARILKSQSRFHPPGKRRYRTVTQVKIHYAAAITSGVRANFTYATECVRETLKMGHKVFVDTLTFGGHDLIFDQLYKVALEKPEAIALLVNRVCHPPPVLEEDKQKGSKGKKSKKPSSEDKESKEEYCSKISDEEFLPNDGVNVGGNKLPDLKNQLTPEAWFLTHDILLAGRPRPEKSRVEPKKVLTEQERVVIRKLKKGTDSAVRAATLHCLKQCLDSLKKKV